MGFQVSPERLLDHPIPSLVYDLGKKVPGTSDLFEFHLTQQYQLRSFQYEVWEGRQKPKELVDCFVCIVPNIVYDPVKRSLGTLDWFQMKLYTWLLRPSGQWNAAVWISCH